MQLPFCAYWFVFFLYVLSVDEIAITATTLDHQLALLVVTIRFCFSFFLMWINIIIVRKTGSEATKWKMEKEMKSSDERAMSWTEQWSPNIESVIQMIAYCFAIGWFLFHFFYFQCVHYEKFFVQTNVFFRLFFLSFTLRSHQMAIDAEYNIKLDIRQWLITGELTKS